MRIVRRKKGNKIYLYLQHSFRKQGKVKTVEKYLGKAEELSDKDMKIKIQVIVDEILKESKEILYKNLEDIKKNFQSEWKRIPQTAKKKELEEISIAFTYNTNAIEGSTITLEETREIIHNKISPNKPLRDVKETEAHSKVFLNILNEKEEINSRLLLKWHKEIFGETKPDIAGQYRDYLVRVGAYLAPDWREVEKKMSELIKFIKESRKVNPIELSAKAHYRFEKIHPFGDGNGRIGRLLVNHILWHSGYPMIIIEYKKRRYYYKALQKDEEGFITYFLRRYLSIHKKRYS